MSYMTVSPYDSVFSGFTVTQLLMSTVYDVRQTTGDRQLKEQKL